VLTHLDDIEKNQTLFMALESHHNYNSQSAITSATLCIML